MKKIHLLIIALCVSFGTWAQVQSGIGTTQPTTTLEVIANASNSNVLDGITIPKLTCVEIVNKQLNASPNYGAAQAGTIVYITDVVGATCAGAPVTEVAAKGSGFYVFDGTEFIKIALDSGFFTPNWQKLGNNSTDPATDFVGTTDAQPLVLRTNNVEALRVLTNGDVGIGTATPAANMQIVGNPADNTVADGVILPALTGDQLVSKTINTVFTVAQTGAMVYVTLAPTGTPAVPTEAINVNVPGFYFWDSAQWVKIMDTNSSFYTADGTLTSDRAVTQGSFDVNFDANTLVVDGDGDNVGVGTNTIDESAKLEIVSTSQGVLFPRLTVAERDLITNPAKGLMIFNLDRNCLQVNIGDATTPDWNCVSNQGRDLPLDIDTAATNGFTGVFFPDESADEASLVNTIDITLTNSDFADISFTPDAGDITFSAGGFTISGLVGGTLGTAYTVNGGGGTRTFRYILGGTVPSPGTTITATFSSGGITGIYDLVIPPMGSIFTYKQLYNSCTLSPQNAVGYSDYEIVTGTASVDNVNGDLSSSAATTATTSSTMNRVAASHISGSPSYKIGQIFNGSRQREWSDIETDTNFDLSTIANSDVVAFEAWVRGGGGAGGGTRVDRGAGGAGGGGLAINQFTRTASNIVSFTIGNGGNASSGNDGGSGQDSTVSYSSISTVAEGGAGGEARTNGGSNGNPGAGGSCSGTFTQCFDGNDGGQGSDNTGGEGGGSSTQRIDGGADTARRNNGTGFAGNPNGGGGSGGDETGAFGSNRSGGNGAIGNAGLLLTCPN